MKSIFKSLKYLISLNAKKNLLRSNDKKFLHKINTPLITAFYLISALLLQGCTPFPSNSPHLQLIPPAPLLDQTSGTQQSDSTKTELAIAITGFKLDNNTDLGPALSKLYLAGLTEYSYQSTAYISIEDTIHGRTDNEMVIPLDQTIIDTVEQIDICLVSGELDNNKVLQIKNKWKCKSFALNELLQLEKTEQDFTLTDKSARTPDIALSLNQL